jgi:hypothetical protein
MVGGGIRAGNGLGGVRGASPAGGLHAGPLPPATRTAIAAAITQAPAAARTAVAAVLEAPRSVGTFDYLDPHVLATDPPRYVGKALVLQGEAGAVRERERVVYFTLLAAPRDSPAPQPVNVNSFGATSAAVQPVGCYRVEGVGGGTDQDVPYVIGLKITSVVRVSTGCPAP